MILSTSQIVLLVLAVVVLAGVGLFVKSRMTVQEQALKDKHFKEKTGPLLFVGVVIILMIISAVVFSVSASSSSSSSSSSDSSDNGGGSGSSSTVGPASSVQVFGAKAAPTSDLLLSGVVNSNTTPLSISNVSLPPPGPGNAFTLFFAIRVLVLSPTQGPWKHVVSKADVHMYNGDPTQFLSQCPGVWLDPYLNALTIFVSQSKTSGQVDSSDELTSIRLQNIPLNSWVTVGITGQDRAYKVFLNGRYREQRVLASPLASSSSDLYLNQLGGFNGLLGNVVYTAQFTSDSGMAALHKQYLPDRSITSPTNTTASTSVDDLSVWQKMKRWYASEVTSIDNSMQQAKASALSQIDQSLYFSQVAQPGACRDDKNNYPPWEQRAVDQASCAEACLSDPQCLGMSYDATRNLCQLYGTQTANRAGTGATTLTTANGKAGLQCYIRRQLPGDGGAGCPCAAPATSST
jgi:hypothetical protein